MPMQMEQTGFMSAYQQPIQPPAPVLTNIDQQMKLDPEAKNLGAVKTTPVFVDAGYPGGQKYSSDPATHPMSTPHLPYYPGATPYPVMQGQSYLTPGYSPMNPMAMAPVAPPAPVASSKKPKLSPI